MKTSEFQGICREICGRVWTLPALKPAMDVMCFDIGPRPPASSGVVAAHAYISDLLREVEVTNIHTEPIPVLAWMPEVSLLELVAPRRRHYDSVHMVHSAAADVSGRIVPVSNASPKELDQIGTRLEGSIALIQGHRVAGTKYVPFPLQIATLADRGVAGAIMRGLYVEGCTSIELVGVNHTAPIPVIGISPGDARELLDAANAGEARVRIKTAGTSYAASCSNLAAEIAPPGPSDGVIILSAHLDTFHVNPGALDNLTGVLTVLQIASALAPYRDRFRRTLRIIIYSGEEFGFRGSKEYVERHYAELDNIRFVFNMDTLWTATMDGVAVMWSSEMRDCLDDLYRRASRSVYVENLFCMSSDYLPFMLQGVPSARPADFFDSMPPWSHTRLDTPDQVSLDWIRGNAMVHGQMLAGLLMQPEPLPSRRRSQDEVLSLLAEEGVIESMRAFGFDINDRVVGPADRS